MEQPNTKPRKTGRPSKLTETVRSRLVDFIEKQVPYSVACEAVGIHYHTFLRWMTIGKDQKRGEYKDFFDAMTQAKASGEARLVEMVGDHAPQDWRAAMAILERRHAERWAQTKRNEISGPNRGPLQVEMAYDEDKMIRIAKDLAGIASTGNQSVKPGPE